MRKMLKGENYAVVMYSKKDEKIKLLIIGKSHAPSCFKNVHNSKFNYKSNKTAWITSKLFKNLFFN